VKNKGPRREEISSLVFVPTLGVSFTYSNSMVTPAPFRNFRNAFDAYYMQVATEIISFFVIVKIDCRRRNHYFFDAYEHLDQHIHFNIELEKSLPINVPLTHCIWCQ
jgi:hypothetical protein